MYRKTVVPVMILLAVIMAPLSSGCSLTRQPKPGETLEQAGELRTLEEAPLKEITRSVRRVQSALELTEMDSSEDAVSAKFVFMTSQNRTLRILLTSVSAETTQIRVRFGVLAPARTAKRFLEEVRSQLDLETASNR